MDKIAINKAVELLANYEPPRAVTSFKLSMAHDDLFWQMIDRIPKQKIKTSWGDIPVVSSEAVPENYMVMVFNDGTRRILYMSTDGVCYELNEKLLSLFGVRNI